MESDKDIRVSVEIPLSPADIEAIVYDMKTYGEALPDGRERQKAIVAWVQANTKSELALLKEEMAAEMLEQYAREYAGEREG